MLRGTPGSREAIKHSGWTVDESLSVRNHFQEPLEQCLSEGSVVARLGGAFGVRSAPRRASASPLCLKESEDAGETSVPGECLSWVLAGYRRVTKGLNEEPTFLRPVLGYFGSPPRDRYRRERKDDADPPGSHSSKPSSRPA